jgi:hypothetical protein
LQIYTRNRAQTRTKLNVVAVPTSKRCLLRKINITLDISQKDEKHIIIIIIIIIINNAGVRLGGG